MYAAPAPASNKTPRVGPRDSPIIAPLDCPCLEWEVGICENIGGVLDGGRVAEGRKDDVALPFAHFLV